MKLNLKIIKIAKRWKWNEPLRKCFFYVDNLQEYQKEFLKDNILTVKSQRRFESEMLNVFTEKVSKIALSANDDKIV